MESQLSPSFTVGKAPILSVQLLSCSLEIRRSNGDHLKNLVRCLAPGSEALSD